MTLKPENQRSGQMTSGYKKADEFNAHSLEWESLEERCKQEGLKVVHRFVVVRVGWELDEEAAIAVDNLGTPHIVSTNHGGFRVNELTPSQLRTYAEVLRKWAMDAEYAAMLVSVED